MNHISKLLPPTNILIDLDVTSKKRLFEQVGLLFENNQGIARSLVFDSLFARERLGSTGLGQSVAIPHGRIKGLKDAVGAFARLANPVPFDAPDGKPVSCLEKIKVLNQNIQEIESLCGDALEDGVLMGCDADQIKAALHALIEGLEAPAGARWSETPKTPPGFSALKKARRAPSTSLRSIQLCRLRKVSTKSAVPASATSYLSETNGLTSTLPKVAGSAAYFASMRRWSSRYCGGTVGSRPAVM